MAVVPLGLSSTSCAIQYWPPLKAVLPRVVQVFPKLVDVYRSFVEGAVALPYAAARVVPWKSKVIKPSDAVGRPAVNWVGAVAKPSRVRQMPFTGLFIFP